MAYASEQELIDRYGQDQILVLADRDGDGEVDEDVVARALNDADAEINSYLASRYDLPLDEVPPLLTRLACDITVYNLCDNDALATEQRRKRYEDAVALLKRIAAGTVSLGKTPEPPGSAGVAVVVGQPPRFGRGRFRP